jgi:hypothetical protein
MATADWKRHGEHVNSAIDHIRTTAGCLLQSEGSLSADHYRLITSLLDTLDDLIVARDTMEGRSVDIPLKEQLRHAFVAEGIKDKDIIMADPPRVAAIVRGFGAGDGEDRVSEAG